MSSVSVCVLVQKLQSEKPSEIKTNWKQRIKGLKHIKYIREHEE